MTRSDRMRRKHVAPELLEARWLLAAPQIPGNVGQLLVTQFQHFGFRGTVGTQLRSVRLGGPLTLGVSGDPNSIHPSLSASDDVINSGLIRQSQFNGGGFRTIGLQLDDVVIGGGLTASGSDNEDAGLPPTIPILPALPNRGLVSDSQFNDGGFGTLEIRPGGRLLTREGRVGLQWRKTQVGGPVDVGIDVDVIQPGATTETAGASPSDTAVVSASALSDFGQTVIDFSTNSGRVQDSQLNDGGFGDLGMQWSRVKVGGRVGTTSNSLFLKPQQDNLGPITVTDRDFGRREAGAGVTPLASAKISASPASTEVGSIAPLATGADSTFRTTYDNAATNSGRIVKSQINDGGFGDIGLQWRNVRVGGSVTAAHNSLTVQPENRGQGLITVRGIRFPVAPAALPQPTPRPPLPIPIDPALVVIDGDSVTNALPTPTGPLSPYFPVPFAGSGTGTIPFPGNFPLVNSATNSGLVRYGQISAGGFGDQGLQWQDVSVRGDVRLVHNSLSVHPEGSGLEGIAVSDVLYGTPVTPDTTRHLAVLPYAVISTGTPMDASGKVVTGGEVLRPPNDRILTNQQLASTAGTDVFLQWNGIEHRRGLVIVHNIIKIQGVGPQTGPITLSNIRFPFKVPPTAPLTMTALPPSISVKTRAPGESAASIPREDQLLNSANNSGIIDHAQFSDGGFGDDGLQWRHVNVGGSVDLVHNTLAVDATADLPPGEVAGPITISGVTFNSGALRGNLSRPSNHVIVSPPDRFQRVSSHPVKLGKALPSDPSVRQDSTNSGVLAGGQLSAGGANHALLQWQCVRAGGKVRVIDNVLSISVLDRPSGPITISNVTFA